MKLDKKEYKKPQLLKTASRIASAHVCCGMGSTSTCSINRSRIS